MKKLILSTAILLGGLTAATAQTDKEATAMTAQKQSAVEVAVENRLDAAQDVQVEADAEVSTTVEADAAALAVLAPTQDYKEIKTSEIPQNIQAAVAKDFNGATISKAYLNAKGDYKIEIATADAKSATVYANAKGEWIKKESKKQ